MRKTVSIELPTQSEKLSQKAMVLKVLTTASKPLSAVQIAKKCGINIFLVRVYLSKSVTLGDVVETQCSTCHSCKVYEIQH